MRPMRNDELLYKDIHHTRLLHSMPEILPIFTRFIESLSPWLLEMGIASMKIDLALNDDKNPDVLQILCWKSIAKWCNMSGDNTFKEINIILQEHCVFKNKDPEFTNIWIGYCISSVSCVKGIHREHLQGKHLLLLKKMPNVIIETKDDMYKDLYI